ncbi:DUF4136 domain-containing protein [Pigmentiphaga aceris]|nr:DUF4136 domain-containing protein [Pigmentiphaga aceris]
MSSRVTTFQQWPANATGSTYVFERVGSQRDSLEHEQYEEEARAALGVTGLREIRPGETARFGISMEYGVTPGAVSVQRPVTDPFYSNPRPVAYVARDGRVYYRWVQPYPFANTYWENTTVPAFRNALKIEIRDRTQANTKVYETTAVHVGQSENFPAVMPWLLRSAFDNFPNANGQVRDVTYKLD